MCHREINVWKHIAKVDSEIIDRVRVKGEREEGKWLR